MTTDSWNPGGRVAARAGDGMAEAKMPVANISSRLMRMLSAFRRLPVGSLPGCCGSYKAVIAIFAVMRTVANHDCPPTKVHQADANRAPSPSSRRA